jgi:predicted Zn-dependent protease with MMP-like domain
VIGRREFEEQVRLALDALPDELQRRMENVAVLVEEEDADDPYLYGFYIGTPLPERTLEGYAGVAPDAILIYRRPLAEDFGDDPARLREEIRITVLHELAHHFGFDEGDLDELGYG